MGERRENGIMVHRWRGEAEKAGRNLTRMAVAYQGGGFWLARWL
jgi:hypothetical protein